MGLEWSDMKKIKNDKEIISVAALVNGGNYDDLFYLYKRFKKYMKEDGFEVKKDNATKTWFISYSSTNNSKSEKIDRTTKLTFYECERNVKVKKWENYIQRLTNLYPEFEEEIKPEKSNTNEIADLIRKTASAQKKSNPPDEE